ncbi:MAG TPA: carbohydrate ABC transporter permease, partial [Spirochaetia bacterium]|nr:carbohydrate ABC transporter permease [Spirochaetia bacterium]
MKSMSAKQRRTLKFLFYFCGTLIIVLWLIPIIIAVFTSAKSMDEIMGSRIMWSPPRTWVFSNYIKA